MLTTHLLVLDVLTGVNNMINSTLEEISEHFYYVRHDLNYIKICNDDLPLETIQIIDEVIDKLAFCEQLLDVVSL